MRFFWRYSHGYRYSQAIRQSRQICKLWHQNRRSIHFVTYHKIPILSNQNSPCISIRSCQRERLGCIQYSLFFNFWGFILCSPKINIPQRNQINFPRFCQGQRQNMSIGIRPHRLCNESLSIVTRLSIDLNNSIQRITIR